MNGGDSDSYNENENDNKITKKRKLGRPSGKAGPKNKKGEAKAKRQFFVDDTFLNQHSEEIIKNHQAGMKPAQIASILRTSYLQGLREDAITAKQIDNWIQYRKRSGQLKTHPVSLANSNLRADST